MTRPILRRLPEFAAAAVLAVVVALAPARALDTAAWKNRQSLPVPQAGVLKFALPPSTLGLARADLADLRLLDPAGHEVPFVFTLPPPVVPPAVRVPAEFRANLLDSATQLLLATGTTAPLEAVTLATPAPHFLKSARLELSPDGATWETLDESAALFREFGAAHLRFDLHRRTAAWLRITVDDTRTRPVPFTGATLFLAGTTPPEPTAAIAARIVRREEFAGESVLTLDLGGAHVPLAELAFDTPEPLFARPVTLSARELQGETTVDRTLGTGSIWRVSAEGVPATARLDVPVNFTTPSRELLVHLVNGDSPPLPVTGVTARQRPRWLVFRAATPGTYALLTGNAEAAPPRYDLAPLAAVLRDTPPTDLVPGPATPNPGYQAPVALADTPLLGGPLDPAPWPYHKTVQLAAPGVQQLELDLDVLAHAQSRFADLRLVRDGTQVPYLLETTTLARTVPLAVTPANDPKQPRLSRWRIALPRRGLPLGRLTLASPTAVFQRDLRLTEEIADPTRGDTYQRTLAAATWSHTPGDRSTLALPLPSAPAADTLLLETDNGDNPPIALASVSATYPVVRLLFKADPGPLALYYGNPAATAPRYDIALVAAQIVAAEKSVATLGPEETATTASGTADTIAGLPAGVLFWVVLSLVVIALLVVVAKLLPKPPASTS